MAGGSASAQLLKCLLDEHVSKAVAALLRGRGLDAEAVQERPDLTGCSDEQLMDAAAAEGRAVVTGNLRHFRPIAGARLASGASHSGLVLIPGWRSLASDTTGATADAIEQLMRSNPDGIEGSERWLAPLD